MKDLPINPFTGAYEARLPSRWQDITDTPIPVNPFTGKPFPFRRECNAVVLDLEGKAGQLRWWVRLRE